MKPNSKEKLSKTQKQERLKKMIEAHLHEVATAEMEDEFFEAT